MAGGAQTFADQAASCTGKDVYVTPTRAFVVAKRMTRKGKPVSPYRCRHCPYWHLGSNFFGKERR